MFKEFFRKIFCNKKDEELMDFFLQITQKVQQSTCSLNVLFKEYENKKKREYFVYEIETFEKQGDDIVNSIGTLLGEISIPSWISHDVAAKLVHLIDEVLDDSRSVARILNIYNLEKINNSIVFLSETIFNQGYEFSCIMDSFCQKNWQSHSKEILSKIEKIRRFERDGDDQKAKGLQDLWQGDQDENIIKSKLREIKGQDELLKTLEKITDDIHHLANFIHQNLND